MMHITIIYQQFEKLQKRDEKEILNFISKEIISNLKKSRNIAAHDYDSLIFEVVEKVIRTDLPQLKSEFKQILSNFKKRQPKRTYTKSLNTTKKTKMYSTKTLK